MNCCQRQGIESEFNQKYVKKDLKRYRKKGIGKTTRWLIEAIQSAGIRESTLLDIGGGIGAIQHQLLRDGVRSASAVEISPAYLAAAKEEADRLGLEDHIRFYQGDFIELATDIPVADIVTLDRVICCYPEMPKLVEVSM
jgi:ubiquinone/menaquinone biosynthesis C-methylase UbiE